MSVLKIINRLQQESKKSASAINGTQLMMKQVVPSVFSHFSSSSKQGPNARFGTTFFHPQYEVVKATRKFSADNKLGQGDFSAVYKVKQS